MHYVHLSSIAGRVSGGQIQNTQYYTTITNSATPPTCENYAEKLPDLCDAKCTVFTKPR